MLGLRGLGFLLTALVISIPAFADNLLADGSFENPATPSGGYLLYNAGKKIGPWIVTGTQVAAVNGSFQYDGATFDAKNGAVFIDLTGATDTASGVSQTVKTVIGATYQLSFSVGAVYDPTGYFSTSSTVLAYNGPTLLLSAKYALAKPTTMQLWKKFTTSFVATSTSTTIRFVNGNIYNSAHQNCALDSVSLTMVAAPTDSTR